MKLACFVLIILQALGVTISLHLRTRPSLKLRCHNLSAPNPNFFIFIFKKNTKFDED